MKTVKVLQILLVLGLLAGSAAVYWVYFARPAAQPAKAQTQSGGYTSSAAVRGDISISAAGSGTLSAAQTADLAFLTNGRLAALNVQAGDKVSAGQVLAQLDTIAALKQAVANQELAVLSAQKAIDDLNNNAPAVLAQAQVDLTAAQAALVSAQNNLHDPHDWRCPDSTTAAYYQQYLDATLAARPWQALLAKATEVQKQYYLEHLNPILKKMDQAYMNYTYCQAYTPEEISNSQANLKAAQANLVQLQKTYDQLKASNGLDASALAIANAGLKNARIQLVKAQKDLENATLRAPFDANVIAVTGAVGQPAGTAAVITLAAAGSGLIAANIDETDLSNIGLGCATTVTFASLPAKPFTGSVSQIAPSLMAVRGVNVVQIQVSLKDGAMKSTPLPMGSAATLQVVCAQAQNAILIPVQAIYNDPSGTFVYVLNALGQAEKRAVQIGIKTSVTAEVRGGLSAGERVITSTVNLP